jgi:hypothetical protein
MGYQAAENWLNLVLIVRDISKSHRVHGSGLVVYLPVLYRECMPSRSPDWKYETVLDVEVLANNQRGVADDEPDETLLRIAVILQISLVPHAS